MVSRATRISPGAAPCSSRAAVFMTSPVAGASSPPLTSASPVAIPMRMSSSTPSRGRRGVVQSLEGVSHRETTAHGTLGVVLVPQGNTEHSDRRVPDELLRVPPNRCTTERMRSKYDAWTFRSASESRRSPNPVEPT
jgi:hypothetical protein